MEKTKSYEIDMCHGPLFRKILLFTLPLMLSGILQLLFNAADVIVVGQFAGNEALAAVGSTSALTNLLVNLFIGLSVGVNVLVARFYGAQQEQEAQEAVHTAVVVSGLGGILLAFIGIVLAQPLLQWMDTPDDVISHSVLYMRIYFVGMPVMLLYNFGSAILRAIGHTRRPLYFLAAAGVINVILNLIFVIVCKLDVVGVALASALSQCLSAFLIVMALFRSHEDFGLHLAKLRLSKDKAQAILRLGIPSGFQNAIFGIANLFVQLGVNSFSAVMVAGNSAAANADALIYDVMAAFYTACASFMGQNYGSGNKKRVRDSYFVSLAYSFGIGLAMGLLLVVFGKQFLSLFTNDPEVMAAGMKRLTIMGFSYGISAFMDCTIAASRALGKSLAPMVIVILGSCVFRIAWVYTVFAYFQTIPSLYLLYSCSWSLTAIAEILYFVHAYRRAMEKIADTRS